ncbi:SRPBCC domain-containing protein [Glaciibacter flavus]|uniref:SRPBCC domain-containing protein n=1 Tax=Orlajensenia flava TaxID=2565934 RepID=UPI003AFFFEBD
MSDGTQVYQVFIKATPEEVWEAITRPDHSVQYFHGAATTNTAERHETHGPDGSDWGSGAVMEFDPPRRLVHEWRSAYDTELGAEPASRVSWELDEVSPGLTRLALVHDRLDSSPRTAESVSGPGWMYVLSSLKSYLETGEALPRAE